MNNQWDLTYLYASEDLFEKDLALIQSYPAKILSFKNKLGDEKSFVESCLLELEIEKVLGRAYQYASLRSDLNKKNVENNQKVMECGMLFNAISEASSYQAPEILSLGEEKVMAFIDNHPEIEQFRFGFQKLFHESEHILETKAEQLLSYFGPINGKGGDLYSMLCVADSDSKSCTLSDGKEVTVTQGNWTSLICDAKTEEDRKLIFETLYGFYDSHKNVLGEMYNTTLQTEFSYVKSRNYKSILEYHLFKNNIPTSVFENLIKVAGSKNESLKKYIKLRQEYLGIKNYCTYDRFLELAKSNKKYSYDEAKELFFASVKKFPQDFQDKAHEVLKDGFVDVFEQEGKRSGAYSSGEADLHPYILLNYDNTLDSVFTVAHEAGHSIHSMYACESQPTVLQGYTIFVAEIASTFNEHNLLDYIIESGNATKDEKIMLLQKAIDEICSTFYRQTLFAEYEYQASKLVEQNQPLNHQVLSNIMIDLYKKYYGLDITKEGLKQFVWAYIPHLFYTPFYVYQYATSFAASFALYKNVKEQGLPAFERYTGLLKSGGSKYPVDQAKEAGVDFTDIKTFDAVVERMDELVNQLEKLLKE